MRVDQVGGTPGPVDGDAAEALLVTEAPQAVPASRRETAVGEAAPPDPGAEAIDEAGDDVVAGEAATDAVVACCLGDAPQAEARRHPASTTTVRRRLLPATLPPPSASFASAG